MSNTQKILSFVLLLPHISMGHHSRVEFADGAIQEIEGEVVTVFWQNPHAHFTIKTVGGDGVEAIWDLESADIVTLNRRGVPRDAVRVGERLRVAGFRSARRENYLDITNVLLPSGTEVVFTARAEPRWSDDVIGAIRTENDINVAAASSDSLGIFRVWTRAQTNLPELSELPLTDSARTAQDAFDPLIDDPVLSCIIPGMPRSMTFTGPHPIEFLEGNNEIVLRMEYFDHVRRIHMDKPVNVDEQPATPLGYSVGYWDGETLVVTTTRINWPYFDLNAPLLGFPQSNAVEIVERFKLRENGTELAYDITVSDPTTFTEPLVLRDYLIWHAQPGVRRELHDCIVNTDISRG